MRKVKATDFNHPEWGIESYDLLRNYTEIHNTFPNNTVFMGSNFGKGFINADKLIELIEALPNCKILFKANTFGLGLRKIYYEADGYFFILENIHQRPSDNFVYETDAHLVSIVGSFSILHKELDLPSNLEELVSQCFMTTEKVPMVGIISRDNSGFFLNEVKIETKISPELELHYGDKFPLFHETLIDKLVTTNKGLTLLHGDAGTGKSSYIRKLIYDLKQATNKKIIIVPNNLIGYLVDPEFNTFLLDTVESYQYDEDIDPYLASEGIDINEDDEDDATNGIILILEDAESVLLKRERGDSNQGTSNILNLTDGLLNDIFGIQIIATYNTTDENIDPAIMRSKRLIAKRNFKKLPVEQSKKLAEFLNVPGEEIAKIKKALSVAEIYTLLDIEKENILIEKEHDTKPLGFKM